PVLGVDLHHPGQQSLELIERRIIICVVAWERGEVELCTGGIVPCEELVEHRAQAVDVGLRSCLHLAVLLRSGVASRAEKHRISGFATFEAASNAEINEVEPTIVSAHHVGGLEITVDNSWLACM